MSDVKFSALMLALPILTLQIINFFTALRADKRANEKRDSANVKLDVITSLANGNLTTATARIETLEKQVVTLMKRAASAIVVAKRR